MSEDEDKTKGSEKKDQRWIAIGLALGTGIGAAMDNIGLGIAIGIAIGAALMTSGTPLGGKKD